MKCFTVHYIRPDTPLVHEDIELKDKPFLHIRVGEMGLPVSRYDFANLQKVVHASIVKDELTARKWVDAVERDSKRFSYAPNRWRKTDRKASSDARKTMRSHQLDGLLLVAEREKD